MSTNIRNIEPFNWKSLVSEAIKRREEEKLTQKMHALLAGVSVPTMQEFERGSTTITLQKVMDILGVVGLISNEEAKNNLEIFCETAEQRWYSLVQNLLRENQSKNRGREMDQTLAHTYGAFTYTFAIVKKTPIKIDVIQLKKMLIAASRIKYTKRAPFYIYSNNPYLKPNLVQNNIIECWYKSSISDDMITGDTSDNYFWWASTDGQLHYHKGYMEDNWEKGSPGKILYIDVAIAQAVEMILFARRLSSCWHQKNDETTKIDLFLNYRGLTGRRLAVDSETIQSYICKQDLYKSRVTFDVDLISEDGKDRENLIDLIYELLSKLFHNFDFYKLSRDYFADTIEKTISKKASY